MSQSLYGFEKSFKANADFRTTTAEYRVMRIADSSTVDIVNTTTDFAIGILQNKCDIGGAANVRMVGTSKAIAAASIAVGDLLTFNTSGAIQTQASTALPTATVSIIGVALENASTNSVIEIFLTPYRAGVK